MLIGFTIITLLYLFLIGSLAVGFDKLKTVRLDDIKPKTKFSVIIPFRNEAQNLPELLVSISTLNYPKDFFEIIFVDDESDDDSVEIIKTNQSKRPYDCAKGHISIITNKRTTNSPKKDAITTAIQLAEYDWIITTDADCLLPKYWLDSYDDYIQKNNSKLIAGPVVYSNTNSFLNAFQTLDFLSLIGATIGGFGINKPFLCNGANLAYQKDYFISINGFEGNTNIASGDDIFLMQKALKKDKKSVHYLKNKQATVTTKPQSNFKALLAQRVRWASKTSNYNNTFAKLVGLLVLLINAALVIGFVLSVFGLFQIKALGYLFFIKVAIDFLLIYKTSVFFNKENVLKHYIWSCFAYPFFSVFVAFISVFSTYKWKGREFKK